MIILDTNVVSEPLRPRPDARVIAWLDRQELETMYLASVSLAELLLGVELMPNGRRRREFSASLQALVGDLVADRIVAFDQKSAKSYATLVARARSKGLAISMSDAQIAAVAAARGFAVATRDVAAFRAAGVDVINPWEQA